MNGSAPHPRVVVLALIAACWLPAAASAANSIGYVSQQGDYIGQGQTKSYTDADGTFTSNHYTDAGAHISFEHATNFAIWWDVDLMAPQGARLAPGTYLGATRYPFQDAADPGLNFSGSGRGCNTLSGSFEVSDVVYDWFGAVVRLAATFTQHCENQTPALFGTVNYQLGSVGPATVGLQNVLVTWDNRVFEFTRAGTLVHTIPILGGTQTPAATEVARDLVRDSSGRVHVFNGTATPVLSTLVPVSGAWTEDTASGWATVNNTTYGGIAPFGSLVFVSDMSSAGNPAVGIIRFDANHVLPTTSFAGSYAYVDLAAGLDGKLYGLRDDKQHVDAFDPVTLASAGTVTLATTVNAIAVDENSRIFAAVSNVLYRFDATGAIETSLNPGFSGLGDIDLSSTGAIVAGTSLGRVVLTTTALTTSTSFPVSSPPSGMTFVAFAEEPRDLDPVFRDGFESGSFLEWSAHNP